MPASATEREAAVRAAFAEQADWCERLGSPFTARLCTLLGERLDRETPVGWRVLDWPGDPRPSGDVLALRICGGLHALARSGAVPGLAACYPPNPLPDDERLWREVGAALAERELLPWLDRPPQTNEVGRSAVLMGGLLAIAERFPQPMELLELGASAGLNLILDRYGYRLGGALRGATSSTLRLQPEWRGPPPPDSAVVVAGRRGVDLQPMSLPRDAERLLAYVWPDQLRRVEQLEAALTIASADPPQVDAGDAAPWIEARLAEPSQAGVTRVVLHSVAFQYFAAEAQARVERVLAAAGASSREERPLAWLRYERLPEEKDFSLRLRTWPGREERLLARAHAHGAWVEWLA